MPKLPSLEMCDAEIRREKSYRCGYCWALADAGSVITQQMVHAETPDEYRCLLALLMTLGLMSPKKEEA